MTPEDLHDLITYELADIERDVKLVVSHLQQSQIQAAKDYLDAIERLAQSVKRKLDIL